MGPCIAILCQYMSNKMQLYTVYFICKLLYMFRAVSPPIIRSTNNCIYSIWYWGTVVAICRVNKCPRRCNYTQFILSVNCSTCFGWFLHPSSGAQITVSTAPGTSQPLLLPVATVEELRLLMMGGETTRNM